MNELGKWIEKKLAASGATPEALADAMGIDANTLNEIIAGRIKRPPDMRLQKLADYFGVELKVVTDLVPQPSSTDRVAVFHYERLAASTAVDASGALKRVKLSPIGRVTTKRGEYVLDDDDARDLVEKVAAHGAAIPIDFEHESMSNARAETAGWIERLEHAIGDGLYGLIRWTDKARELIRSDQVRYISPTWWINKNNSRVAGLDSAAVTNHPAIPRMERLAASGRTGHDGTRRVQMATMRDNEGYIDLPMVLAAMASQLGISITGDESIEVLTRKVQAEVGRLVEETAKQKEQRGLQPNAEDRGELRGKVSEVAELLRSRGMEISDDAVEDVLAAVIKYLKAKDDQATVEPMPSSVRRFLEVDGPEDEPVRLMPTSDGSRGGGPRDVAMVQRAYSTRDLLREYRDQGVIEPSKAQSINEDWKMFAEMAWSNPEQAEKCLRLICAWRDKALAPFQGRTVPPDEAVTTRGNVIRMACGAYARDDKLKRITSARAYVNDQLREKGLEPASDDELRTFAVATVG